MYGEWGLGVNNTILLLNFSNLSSSCDPTSSSPCTHKKTEKMHATVHSNNIRNISTKSKKGLHACCDNSISALGYMIGIAIASLNVNSLLFHIGEVRTLIRDLESHILAINESKLDDSIDDALLSIDG